MVSAFAADLPKGRIIDQVVCSADPTQSYALYLPSAYSTERAWPVLYCLDPLARGRLPLEQFREGAEKYGYILAGSYNSRNGPLAPALEALRAVWRNTHETLRIDDRRVYLAGMSGGARDATVFLNGGAFAGVIAQAAGFSGNAVPKDFSFPFFGTAGFDDFNYDEMRQVDRELDSRAAPHRLVLFPGPHGWAPASVCAEALGWLDLVAMRAGTKPSDKALIHALFEQDVSSAAAAEAQGEFIAAWLRYRSLAAGYKDWENVAPYERKAAELKDSKEYRRALKAEDGAAARQRELLATIFSNVRKQVNRDADEVHASPRVVVADLRSKAASAQDSDERRIARRALREATVTAWEESTVLRSKKDYSSAAATLEVAALVEPDNPEVLYNLAALSALSNDKGRAMSLLKKAVEKGLRDRSRIEKDPAFDSLRQRAEFRALVGQGSR